MAKDENKAKAKNKAGKAKAVVAEQAKKPKSTLTNKQYEAELQKLQVELIKLQAWIKEKGLVVVLFEGRDAAGKGAQSSASPAEPPHRAGRRLTRAY